MRRDILKEYFICQVLSQCTLNFCFLSGKFTRTILLDKVLEIRSLIKILVNSFQDLFLYLQDSLKDWSN